MCDFELYECGSIYIFVISMYIYTIRCLYVEFRCICVRFDNFVRNGTPYLRVTEGLQLVMYFEKFLSPQKRGSQSYLNFTFKNE